LPSSLVLRLASLVEPRKRLEEVYRQLWGIGGARSTGFGKQRVRSLPDAVAQVLGRHLDWIAGQPPWIVGLDPSSSDRLTESAPAPVLVGLHADLCPESGEVSLVTTQGCGSCIACGYSEC